MPEESDAGKFQPETDKWFISGFSVLVVSNSTTQHASCKSSWSGKLFPVRVLVSLYSGTSFHWSVVFLHPPEYLSDVS